MKMTLLAALVVSVAVGGCTTTKPEAGAKAGTMSQAQATETCLGYVKFWSVSFKHEAAAFMNVSVAQMPGVFCQRLIAGLASGRITREDIAKLRTAHASNFYKVIKGN